MKSASLSAIYKSDRQDQELSPFTGRWNTPIIVKITKISQITKGPVIYSGQDIVPSMPQKPFLKPNSE